MRNVTLKEFNIRVIGIYYKILVNIKDAQIPNFPPVTIPDLRPIPIRPIAKKANYQPIAILITDINDLLLKIYNNYKSFTYYI